MSARSEKRASWSLLLGFLGLVTCGVTGLPAIVLGALALRDATERDRGRALAGIALGIVVTSVWALVIGGILWNRGTAPLHLRLRGIPVELGRADAGVQL